MDAENLFMIEIFFVEIYEDMLSTNAHQNIFYRLQVIFQNNLWAHDCTNLLKPIRDIHSNIVKEVYYNPGI